MADLITLDQFKVAVGIEDNSRDAQIAQAIGMASVAVRSYTERNIGAPTTTETRTYLYDGSGWLTIDDATAVSAVALDGMSLTDDYSYVLGPDRKLLPDAPLIYEWIELVPFAGMSPQMGFMYNLDQLWWKVKPIHKVAVTADFGWAGAVPLDVQQATVYTAVEFAERPVPFISRNIDSYGVTNESPLRNAIPDRAKELLFPYRRGLS